MVDACIFLLENFVESGSYTLVNALTEKYQKSSKYPIFLTKIWSNAVFFLDKYFFNTINSYNKGLITTEQFTTKMSNQFSLEEIEFVDVWKSIYKISPKFKESFVEKISSMNETKIFLVGVTNEIHFQSFLDQLDRVSSIKNNNFYTLLSYKSINHFDSVKELIEEGLSSAAFSNEYKFSICSMVEISGVNLSEECCIYPTCHIIN